MLRKRVAVLVAAAMMVLSMLAASARATLKVRQSGRGLAASALSFAHIHRSAWKG